MQKIKTHAFTLVEILIVIIIIGILAGALYPRIIGTRQKADDVSRINDLHQVALALQRYNRDHGNYPTGCGDLRSTLKINTFSGYMDEIPSDPDKNNALNGAESAGEYFYCSLKKRGIKNASYVLVLKPDSFKKANFNVKNFSRDKKKYDIIKNKLEACPNGIKESDSGNACTAERGDQRYIILGP